MEVVIGLSGYLALIVGCVGGAIIGHLLGEVVLIPALNFLFRIKD